MIKSQNSGAPAIDGAVAILDLLAQEPHPLQLADICERTGLAPASAHRILHSMLGHELVAIAPGRRKTYLVGARVFQLSSAVLGRQPIVPHFHPIAEILRNEIHRTVLLGLPVGSQMVVVAKVDSPANFAFNAYVGRTMPIDLCAGGRAVLAALDPAYRLILLRGAGILGPDEPLAGPRIVDIERAARLGYAVTSGEIQPGVGCIAAPVLNRSGMPVAAVSACFPQDVLTASTARSYAKNIVQAARQLSSHIL
ncbi:MAG TPA: IclR family transcriptional regulator [Paenirhodobacter sp.]